MKDKIGIFFSIIFILIGVGFGIVETQIPTGCQDSDGDCSIVNINASDDVYEAVDLLTFPFGWINITNLSNSINETYDIENATLLVEWYSDTGLGASNIRIDYHNGTGWVNCAGPFGESATETNTTCDISQLTAQQINNLMARIRGEDIEFPNAFVYIDYVEVQVNSTGAPQWTNQSSSQNTTRTMISLNLTAQGFSELSLSYAWISTNETGKWVNYTDDTYGSPLFMGNITNQWLQSNFTWNNASVLLGSVGWRIYYNDTRGRITATDVQEFYIQFTRTPNSCKDSDGDCSVSNINVSDNTYETIDLLTFPFGYINASDWDIDIPANNQLNNAYAYVEWHTDIGLGVSNISINYWDGSNWIQCTGPFTENGTDQISSCNLSSLTISQINSIMIRFNAQDAEFPPAFAYVDYIYMDANYTGITGAGFLEVNITLPNVSTTTNIIQNTTFTVNATIYCRNASCGNINGTVRYNYTSANPDTPINTTIGDVPFYIDETPALATKICPTNPLGIDEFCNFTWIINATGALNSNWKVDVIFESSNSSVQSNHTADANISLISCTVDFTLQWSFIDFGHLSPNTNNNAAPGNTVNTYNISVNPGSCNLDFYIRGTNLTNTTLGTTIGVGNLSWNNVTNDAPSAINLTINNTFVRGNVAPITNITTWYWLDIPAIFAGMYEGIISITGVQNGENP